MSARITPVLGPTCRDDGGTGLGGGHNCYCVRILHHPLDSDRPHECSCTRRWADSTPDEPDVESLEYEEEPGKIIFHLPSSGGLTSDEIAKIVEKQLKWLGRWY